MNSLMALEGDLNAEQESALDSFTFVTVRTKVLFARYKCLVIH